MSNLPQPYCNRYMLLPTQCELTDSTSKQSQNTTAWVIASLFLSQKSLSGRCLSSTWAFRLRQIKAPLWKLAKSGSSHPIVWDHSKRAEPVQKTLHVWAWPREVSPFPLHYTWLPVTKKAWKNGIPSWPAAFQVQLHSYERKTNVGWILSEQLAH